MAAKNSNNLKQKKIIKIYGNYLKESKYTDTPIELDQIRDFFELRIFVSVFFHFIKCEVLILSFAGLEKCLDIKIK